MADQEQLTQYFNHTTQDSWNSASKITACCRGSPIIVPKQGREGLLALLHAGHPGISKLKGLACSYVWWPNIDADLEVQVKQCNQCQVNQLFPPAEVMHPWE